MAKSQYNFTHVRELLINKLINTAMKVMRPGSFTKKCYCKSIINSIYFIQLTGIKGIS